MSTPRADQPSRPVAVLEAEFDPRGIHATVAGALFDFLGHLTTLDEELLVGSVHPPHRALDELQSWADARGLNIDAANVPGWQNALAVPTPPKAVGGSATAFVGPRPPPDEADAEAGR